jgi:hypothetical protein
LVGVFLVGSMHASSIYGMHVMWQLALLSSLTITGIYFLGKKLFGS